MHTNWNSNSDPLLYFGLIQRFPALIDVRDICSEPITHWTIGFFKHNRAAGRELCDCSVGVSRGRCLSGGSRPRLLRDVPFFHERLPQGLSERKRCHHTEYNA
jgi:hypothetical protein